jgi:hypothetical protein
MNRVEIIKYYDNMIDDIADEELREKLTDELTEIDEQLFSLDCEIEKAIDEQEADYLPSHEEQRYGADISFANDYFSYNGR